VSPPAVSPADARFVRTPSDCSAHLVDGPTLNTPLNRTARPVQTRSNRYLEFDLTAESFPANGASRGRTARMPPFVGWRVCLRFSERPGCLTPCRVDPTHREPVAQALGVTGLTL
jgi:hypothetical protein